MDSFQERQMWPKLSSVVQLPKVQKFLILIKPQLALSCYANASSVVQKLNVSQSGKTQRLEPTKPAGADQILKFNTWDIQPIPRIFIPHVRVWHRIRKVDLVFEFRSIPPVCGSLAYMQSAVLMSISNYFVCAVIIDWWHDGLKRLMN